MSLLAFEASINCDNKRYTFLVQSSIKAEYTAIAYAIYHMKSLLPQYVQQSITVEILAYDIFIKEDIIGCILFVVNNLVNDRHENIDV